MKYLKDFSSESDYLDYRNSNEFIKPNISFCDDRGSTYYNYPPHNTNGYSYVDLGLPSGTLWAAMNVGASNPLVYGLYFAWGDTSGYTADQVGTGDGQKKFASDWSGYKWGAYPNLTKYTNPGDTLDLEDDAAHVYMGGDWHMPTPEQFEELTNTANTIMVKGVMGGTACVAFVSKNDTSKLLIIPAAGFIVGSSIQSQNMGFCVWSSVCDAANGNGLYADSKTQNLFGLARNYGCSVRGVIDG